MPDIKNAVFQSGFKFKKSLGQNFITDTNLLRAIVSDSGADKDTAVIEIGAGAGTLTREIALTAKKVTAYEIDQSLKAVIENTLAGVTNAETVFSDILRTDISETEKKAGGDYIVIANLPYYITSAVIMHFLEKSARCKSLTVMVQKEVAERLCAKAGTPQYGAITVAVDSCGGGKITRTVPRTMFYPRPQVDSAVVRIDINRNSITVRDRELFKKICRCAFSARRKTLANNISKGLNIDKARTEKIISECGYKTDIRGETLSAGEFALLSDRFSQIL